MAKEDTETGHASAQTMLDIYESVGATRFDVTGTTRSGDKDWARRGMSIADLRRALPGMLEAAVICERNVIVRPRGSGVAFIQLDDLKAEQLPALAPAVFLILETSPANFQAWVAMPGIDDKDFARRLKKGVGRIDKSASGATRIAGSFNFKDKYAPDFPRVAIREAHPGRMTSKEELDRLGLVATPEIQPEFQAPPSLPAPGRQRKLPSYAMCLERAPLNSEQTGPDTSYADIAFCMIAISWGWSVEDTARRLIEEPDSKAHRREPKYAEDTARKAALYVQQRRMRPRQRMAGHGRR